ncbi:hypothetical protein PO124_29100 [Bacillus licheniformis]|nr:hypothetical protein [Bacillus licheniformis]
MVQLHQGNRSNLEISPNLWAGIGLVRGGAGTALVGDPETVASRIKNTPTSALSPLSSQVIHILKKRTICRKVFRSFRFERNFKVKHQAKSSEMTISVEAKEND